MIVRNQIPVSRLSPVYDTHVKGDFDPMEHLTQCVIDPLMTPIDPKRPVEIESNGNKLDADDVSQIISSCLGDSVDPVAEAQAKLLLDKCVTDFDPRYTMPVDMLYVTCAAKREQLAEPDGKDVFYTARTDIIPTSAKWLEGTATDDALLACFAYFARPDTLAFAFPTAGAFDDFKTWLKGEVNTISAALPPECVRLFSNFDSTVTLDELTESIWLRKSAADGCDEYAFARVFMAYVMRYAKNNPAQCLPMPFSLNRLLLPESLVFVNVDAHSHATPSQINDEWKLIRDSIADDLRVVRPGQIQKLTAVRKAMRKTAAQAVTAGASRHKDVGRMSNIRFRKRPPTRTDIARVVKRIMGKLASVNHSQNIYKQTKMSFARPNRRDPDDFNRQGKVVSTRYMPDIHLYVDTSGSISEEQYQDAVMSIIQLVRKLDVNLYFNSFSHVMSTSTFLPTRGRSAAQVWNQLQHVPKVTGWTDYEQIWAYVEASKKRRRELSLVITDFEWRAPMGWRKHPKNLYYLPISTNDWDEMVKEAQTFVNSMTHIKPDIRKHVLA